MMSCHAVHGGTNCADAKGVLTEVESDAFRPNLLQFQ
jgi:hypothetical protein